MPHLRPLSKDVRALEALIRECGHGETLQRHDRPRHAPVPSGIESLDGRLGGGLPRGSISGITGQCSSGRTGLVLGALAWATQAGEIAAYVDATDCLDPRSAKEAGVVLERMLWVRCGDGAAATRRPGGAGHGQADQAWQATSIAVSSGAFGIVALDLGGLSANRMGQWQRYPWIRLKRSLEGSSTVLVVLARKHLAASAADIVLELRRESTEWDGLLGGIGIRARVMRDRLRRAGPGAGRQAA